MVTLIKKQQGFSFVELMIALTLSLLLCATLFYSVLADMRTYDSTRATQGLITKSRMSMGYMKLYLQQAGFRDLAQLKLNIGFAAQNGWLDGQILRGFNNLTSATTTGFNSADGADIASKAKAGTDLVLIRYLGATTGIFDCQGNALTQGQAYQAALYINNSEQLICDDGTSEEILDEQIEHLHLLYALEEAPNCQYFNATEIENNQQWNAINRIKVGLLAAQSVQSNRLQNSNSYQLFDRSIASTNDSNFRKTSSETILIRSNAL